MSGKTVTRSVRFEVELDHRVERLATASGQSVSAFIRAALVAILERTERRERLEHALRIAETLPDTPLDRDAMWGQGSRVPI